MRIPKRMVGVALALLLFSAGCSRDGDSANIGRSRAEPATASEPPLRASSGETSPADAFFDRVQALGVHDQFSIYMTDEGRGWGPFYVTLALAVCSDITDHSSSGTAASNLTRTIFQLSPTQPDYRLRRAVDDFIELAISEFCPEAPGPGSDEVPSSMVEWLSDPATYEGATFAGRHVTGVRDTSPADAAVHIHLLLSGDDDRKISVSIFPTRATSRSFYNNQRTTLRATNALEEPSELGEGYCEYEDYLEVMGCTALVGPLIIRSFASTDAEDLPLEIVGDAVPYFRSLWESGSATLGPQSANETTDQTRPQVGMAPPINVSVGATCTYFEAVLGDALTPSMARDMVTWEKADVYFRIRPDADVASRPYEIVILAKYGELDTSSRGLPAGSYLFVLSASESAGRVGPYDEIGRYDVIESLDPTNSSTEFRALVPQRPADVVAQDGILSCGLAP